MTDLNKEFFDKWEDFEKIKMAMLKSIYVDCRTTATFYGEIWSKVYGKSYKEGVARYNEMSAHIKGLLEASLFAKYGKIDLNDIVPDNKIQ